MSNPEDHPINPEDHPIKDFIAGLEEEKDHAIQRIQAIEAGLWKAWSHPAEGEDPTDVSAEHKAELERLVDKVNRIIFAYGPR